MLHNIISLQNSVNFAYFTKIIHIYLRSFLKDHPFPSTHKSPPRVSQSEAFSTLLPSLLSSN